MDIHEYIESTDRTMKAATAIVSDYLTGDTHVVESAVSADGDMTDLVREQHYAIAADPDGHVVISNQRDHLIVPADLFNEYLQRQD